MKSANGVLCITSISTRIANVSQQHTYRAETVKRMLLRSAVLCLGTGLWLAQSVAVSEECTQNPTLHLPEQQCEAEAATKQVSEKDRAISLIPIIFYTNETSLGLGAGFVRAFRWDGEDKKNSRPSNIKALGTYTLRDQSSVLLSPDLYLGAQQYNLRFSLGYSNYPNVFFGTGEDLPRDAEGEDYTERLALFTGTLVRSLYRGLRAGLRLDYTDSEIYDVEPGGLLDQELFVGSEGGTDVGLGAVLEWDDRDQIFWPTSGGYHQLNAVWHDPDLGGDFYYYQTTADMRHFMDLGKDRVLALRGYAVVTNGEAPFQKLAQLGGPNLMRGIYLGRFRDNHALVAQGEYRVILNNRWSITAFASVGEVAHEMNDFRLSDAVYTVGGGARYALDPKNRINLRMDLGISEYGTSPIIVFQEVF